MYCLVGRQPNDWSAGLTIVQSGVQISAMTNLLVIHFDLAAIKCLLD